MATIIPNPQSASANQNKEPTSTVTEIPANNAKPAVKNSLAAGESLKPDQCLQSTNGKYKLYLQGDGNFVLYDGTNPYWASNTSDDEWDRPVRAIMQADGNLVLYSRDGDSVWASNTNGKGGNTVTLQDDGSLVITAGQNVVWSTNTPRVAPTYRTLMSLTVGDTLKQNEKIVSPNAKYNVVLQGDGNFVLYEGTNARWATATNGRGDSVVLRADGTLAVIGWSGDSWTGKAKQPPSGNPVLTLRDDGNLAMTDSRGYILWSNNNSIVTPDSVFSTPVSDGSNMINPGQYLNRGSSLRSSNGIFIFSLDSTGALTLRNTQLNSTIWSASQQPFSDAKQLILQFDGNLVLYGSDGKALWSSQIQWYQKGISLVLGNDGNVVLNDKGGGFAWQTNTSFPGYTGKIDRIKLDQLLLVGQTLTSANGQYKLDFKDNYHFVVRNAQNQETWYFTPDNNRMSGANALRVVEAGFVELVDSTRTPKWSSQSTTKGQYYAKWQDYSRSTEFVIQDDGNAVVLKDGLAVWDIRTFSSAPTSQNPNRDTLGLNQRLAMGQSLTSYNGLFNMILQDDSNLVIYSKMVGAIWVSDTSWAEWKGAKMRDLIMQPDGNLVLYDQSGKSKWASGSKLSNWSQVSSLRLVMQSDGNARVVVGSDDTLWQSGLQNLQERTRWKWQ